ncbi:hypothetical protein CDL12_22039 [Handroanthus impetiginosus]|uniref:Pectinesterase inhibitor domain-containing protein n=1 Tax=Handroanthus impetiginosus TaxID=429701 RepID=A0A2G9GJF2_9LAMI|nr:hypothetical protein CDL12_22039 [Handroanthus impetiginosus]
MKSYSYFIPLSLFIIPFLITITQAQDLINSTCKTFSQTDPNIDYNFCTTSLQAANGSHCTTVDGLGKISLRLVHDNVTDTKCYIKHLIRKGKWDPYIRQCLGDCLQLFSDATASVDEAIKYYDAKKFDDANVQISSVMDGATTCEDGFKERRGIVSPLTKRNDNVFQLTAVALSVMHMVQTGSG